MAATHKFSRAHITIDSSLSPDRVAEISVTVGTQTQGKLLIGVEKVQFDGATPGRTNFSIRSLGGRVQLMTFHMEISGDADGSFSFSSIDYFRTSQSKLFMLIPTGPKFLAAYKTYHLFMESLRAAIRQEDSRAVVEIIERPDALSGPPTSGAAGRILQSSGSHDPNPVPSEPGTF